ncbi:MAG: glutamyl-tRNA reductase [Planctomycetes bacterium]|nr:glutamyl-tRNA reductase [Planctomycetota bacterium]
MEILSLSLNHRVTSLGVREAVVFTPEDGKHFLNQLRERVLASESLLISTCNRTEIYIVRAAGANPELGPPLLDLLKETRGFAATEHPRNYEITRDEEAVRHLFRVAGGLDSQILGESQILGQVKNALAWARSAGTDGRVLHRLWERALRVGKRVRSETALGEGALSASYASLELARKIFGSLKEKHVLVVGTGEIGVLALENLQGYPVASLTIMNRTASRAQALAERFKGKVRDLAELPKALIDADLVISSTSSPVPLIRYEQMRKVRQQRGGQRPLLIVDLAVPRDFEERCGSLDGVFLKNLDDLSEIVKKNIEERFQELPRAEAIIEAEMTTFFRWLRALDVEPTILKLRELFHAVRENELAALRNALDEESFGRLDRLSRRLINRLLHQLSKNLRRHTALQDSELVSVVHELLTEEIPHPNEVEGGGETNDCSSEDAAPAPPARSPGT